VSGKLEKIGWGTNSYFKVGPLLEEAYLQTIRIILGTGLKGLSGREKPSENTASFKGLGQRPQGIAPSNTEGHHTFITVFGLKFPRTFDGWSFPKNLNFGHLTSNPIFPSTWRNKRGKKGATKGKVFYLPGV